ncbi:MAG: immune inhibitor A, partial [Anaerolineales bacterium]|nr:immune inhibitor A [Anaerolineales bacterium]
PTAAPTNTAVSTPTTPPTPTVTQNTAVPTQPTEHAWPPPAKTYSEFSRQPITQAEQLTFDILETDLPPDRDDVALAVAYRGITVPSDNPPLVTEPQSVGTSQPFFVSTYDTNVTTSPEFLLQYVSDHAYFWFDTTPGLTPPDAETLADMGAAFDDIYEKDTFFFGDEANPGVDGDPRVHIVNAAPPTICGDTNACGLLGYVATSNMLPTAVYPTSNQREMFVMNGTAFGSQTYLDVLAHEFRHMIENRYDVNDVDWAVEGSAMLAEDLLGFESDSIFRGNLFLADPDQQLNRWTDGNTIPYYGQGYVMNRYLFNRLGTDLYRVFATHPDPGFLAVDAIAAENGLDFTGLELWLDWLAALAIHNEPNAPEIYALRDGLETAATTVINTFPFNVDTTVNQFAADYYRLSGSGPATLDFTGSNHVPLLAARPLSGETMWVANRANYSMVSMTHAFDLTQVDKATLEYAVFHEIEAGYDFAYASISTDGGRTWQGLTAENMQGTDPVDDPSDVAYTDRFYTGNSDDWVQETADLTPYVGQTVHIRFEYVTDPILTFGGIAFDNIAIPEIGFYDDVESDAGWEAHGFVRAAGYLPQRWHLILITFKDDTPVVQHIPISDDNTATFEFSLNSSGGGRPFLIVAASSPMTLEPAHYQFEIR